MGRLGIYVEEEQKGHIGQLDVECERNDSKIFDLSIQNDSSNFRGNAFIQSGRKKNRLCYYEMSIRKVKSLSCIQLFATPWTVACQAPPSVGFSWQEHWSGVPLPSPLDL